MVIYSSKMKFKHVPVTFDLLEYARALGSIFEQKYLQYITRNREAVIVKKYFLPIWGSKHVPITVHLLEHARAEPNFGTKNFFMAPQL